MEASEFEARKQELMEECTITPEVFVRLMPRLERFMVPFVGRLARKEQIEHARTFVRGLLSDLSRLPIFSGKNACRCSTSSGCLAGTTNLCETNW